MSTLQERLALAMAGPPKIKQTALAKACKLTPASVNDWTRGKTRKIEGANLLAAARFLGVAPEWLASGRGPMRLNGSVNPAGQDDDPPTGSHFARLDRDTFADAKNFVLAEETLFGQRPRNELVEQVFTVYDLMVQSGGNLTRQQREERFVAARLRHSEGEINGATDKGQKDETG